MKKASLMLYCFRHGMKMPLKISVAMQLRPSWIETGSNAVAASIGGTPYIKSAFIYSRPLYINASTWTVTRINVPKLGTMLSKAGKVGGHTGVVLGAGFLTLDYFDPNISKGLFSRFSYKALGFGASTVTGFVVAGSFGGAPGAAAGGVVGAGFEFGEMAYDGYIYLQREISVNLNRLHNAPKAIFIGR